MLKIKAPGLLLKDEAFKKSYFKILNQGHIFIVLGAGETEREVEGERERAKGTY